MEAPKQVRPTLKGAYEYLVREFSEDYFERLDFDVDSLAKRQVVVYIADSFGLHPMEVAAKAVRLIEAQANKQEVISAVLPAAESVSVSAPAAVADVREREAANVLRETSAGAA